MADQFTKITKTGLGSRLGSSIKGVFFGLLLFLASFYLLYWNEGRVDVSEVAKNAVAVSSETVDESADGQFVSTTGKLTSDETIGDNLYLVPGDYLAVERKVEIYAWDEQTSSESTDNWGGSETTETTYTYVTDWVSDPTPTSSFEDPEGHDNPSKTIEDYSVRAGSAKIGAYDLDFGSLTLHGYTDLSLTEENVDLGEEEYDDEYYYDEGEGGAVTELSGNMIFVGYGTLEDPEIGDMRISYSVLEKDIEGTVFGRLDGDKIESYLDEDTGESVYRFDVGGRDAALSTMHGEYTMMLWIFRLVGFLMMWVGLSALFGPLTILLGIVKLGKLSRSLVSGVSFIAALVLSGATILVSMILHSLIAVLVVLVVGAVIFIYVVKKKA